MRQLAKCWKVTAFAAMVLCGGGVRAAAASGGGIHVALVPSATVVSPGGSFDIDFDVTQAGTSFNAYDATFAWDSTAVSFIPASPTSLQEGAYMGGACGNTFQVFGTTADSASISNSLLCNQVTLTGPGQLYHLHFQARSRLGPTTLRLRPGVRFYSAGALVGPVDAADVTVTIGDAAGVETLRVHEALSVRADTNPIRSGTWIRVAGAEGPSTLICVRDAAGRIVRQLGGDHATFWNARDDQGRRLPSGSYWLDLRCGGARAVSRVTLLR